MQKRATPTRAMWTTCASSAVLAHGGDLAACEEELRARLGLVAQDASVVEEAEGRLGELRGSLRETFRCLASIGY